MTEQGTPAAEQAVLVHGPVADPAASRNGDSPVVERRRAARTAKRTFDLIASLVALVLLSPLWLLIALAIKFGSRGPVLFRQTRVGRHDTQFAMLKFRTMERDADRRKRELLHLNEAGEGLFKISQDPRVTRFGRLLRSTSLDELPQLLNVVTGKMSLVGPRPLIPEEDRLIEGEYRRRLELRPGMTGAWQVAGASRIPIREMGKLDLEYLDGWSLWGDVRLLLGTVQHVVRRHGI